MRNRINSGHQTSNAAAFVNSESEHDMRLYIISGGTPGIEAAITGTIARVLENSVILVGQNREKHETTRMQPDNRKLNQALQADFYHP